MKVFYIYDKQNNKALGHVIAESEKDAGITFSIGSPTHNTGDITVTTERRG